MNLQKTTDRLQEELGNKNDHVQSANQREKLAEILRHINMLNSSELIYFLNSIVSSIYTDKVVEHAALSYELGNETMQLEANSIFSGSQEEAENYIKQELITKMVSELVDKVSMEKREYTETESTVYRVELAVLVPRL